MDIYQRNLLLLRLRALKRKFDTGRNAFDNGYSLVHNLLNTAVSDLELLLEGFADREIERNEMEQLANGLKAVSDAADNYIGAKAEVDEYALAADDERNVKKATGDKRTRLEAANSLQMLCQEKYKNVKRQLDQSKQDSIKEDNSNENLLQINKTSGLRQPVRLNELTAEEIYVRQKRGNKIEIQNTVEKFNGARAQYDTILTNQAGSKAYREKMDKAFHYHRDSIMNFDDDESFMKSYTRYRRDIYNSVKAYRRLEELRDSLNDDDVMQFHRELVGMGLSGKSFKKMEDKINELEMIGQYMDTRAALLQNPAYIALNENQEKNLQKKTAEELREIQIGEPDKLRMNAQIAQLKEMEAYGIHKKAQSTRNEWNGMKNRVERDGVTTTLALLTAYEDHGEKLEKRDTFGKKLKSIGSAFLPSRWFHKDIRLTSSDTTVYGTNFRTGEKGTGPLGYGLNAGITVATGKLRGAKIGGKYKSASGRFQSSVHASAGNVKVSTGVGASIMTSSLLESKVFAMASAEATGLKAVSKISLQTDKGRFKVDGRADHQVATASASALGGVGLIRYVDSENKERAGVGVTAELGASAAVYKGSLSGGISIFGVRFGGKVTGLALGVGGMAKFTGASKGFAIGLTGTLGLGVGIELSVDWSGAIDKFRKWKERKAQRKALKQKLQEDKLKKKADLQDQESDANSIDGRESSLSSESISIRESKASEERKGSNRISLRESNASQNSKDSKESKESKDSIKISLK